MCFVSCLLSLSLQTLIWQLPRLGDLKGDLDMHVCVWAYYESVDHKPRCLLDALIILVLLGMAAIIVEHQSGAVIEGLTKVHDPLKTAPILLLPACRDDKPAGVRQIVPHCLLKACRGGQKPARC